MMKDPYQVLGVSRDAPEEEIKKADDAAVSDNEYNKFIQDRQKEGKPLPVGETLRKDAEKLNGQTASPAQTEAIKVEPAKAESADSAAPERNFLENLAPEKR